MAVPLIEQAKIQAKVLVPLVKALRAELGEERANALVRKTLGDHYRKLGKASQQKMDLEKTWQFFAAGGALAYSVLKKSPDAYELDVTECQYAKFYRELGEPELGFLLLCSQDFTFFEGYDSVKLTRTQTIMQGASHCDFRYRLARERDGAKK